jgi:serine/threonine protein kinase
MKSQTELSEGGTAAPPKVMEFKRAKPSLSDFKVGECVGKGNFGEIFRASIETTNGKTVIVNEYALKAISLEKIDTKLQVEHLIREKMIMMDLSENPLH